MKKDNIKFIKKSLLFISICLIVALFIQYFFDNNFNDVKELKVLESEEEVKIIYFGDSIMQSYAKTDIDRRNSAKLLQEYSGENVLIVSNDAYHPGVFEAYSEYICTKENKPDIVIVPINLRSFSPEWDLRPNYQFEDKIEKLSNPDGTVFLRLFKRINDLSGKENKEPEKDWRNTTVYFYNTPRGQVNDYLMSEDPKDYEGIKSKYIFHYLYQLDENHRKVNSLKNMVDNYKNCNITPVLYITPIDYQLGDKYVGQSFSIIVSQNINVLSASVDNTEIINMAFYLNSSSFDHPNSPNEHLKEEGRRLIALRLNTTLHNMSLIG